jgi:hypothetical protein
LSHNIPLGHYRNWSATNKKWGDPNSEVLLTYASYPKYEDGQLTRDELHKGPPFKEGGPFDTIRVNSCNPPLGVYGVGVHMRLDGLKRYEGGFSIPDNADWLGGMSMTSFDSYLSGDASNYPDMADWGDRAYNSNKPQLEKAGAAVFFAELRDLPRMMRTTSRFFHDIWRGMTGSSWSPAFKHMQPKKAADHFLNHQFGWSPFLKDLRKFYNAFDQADNHIEKLTRENGQWIRRKRLMYENSTGPVLLGSGTGVKLFPNSSFDSPFAPWFPPGSPSTWRVTEEVITKVYTVGRWRYYRPEFDKTNPKYSGIMNNMKRQMTLYGARISPSNIYKATPWTWAIDWVSNFGDQIDRANDMLVDSVACQYLYVMQHQQRVRKFYQCLPFTSGTVLLEFSRVIETKQRREGLSPYGFSLSLANLTPRQLAIAGALGISRG